MNSPQDEVAFEAVLEVSDYYDGPREGIAMFRGKPHTFRSRMVDVYALDDTTDIFELTPLEDRGAGRVLAAATFEAATDAPPVPTGQLRKLVVSWRTHDELQSNISLQADRER